MTAGRNILVIKLSALGDFILALGAMESIRRHHPNDRLTLLTTAPFADFAQRLRYFDRVVVDRRPAPFDVPGWARLARFFNTSGFARVYDLQMSDRTRAYRQLFWRRPEWPGIALARDPAWNSLHSLDRHEKLLAEAGIATIPPDCSWMDTDVTHFGLPEPFFLLVPGSSPQHPEKRWPTVKYIGLAQRLIREGYGVALLGTKAESDVTSKIKKACNAVVDLTGQTSLADIAALSRRASGAVGNDTGPMHLIALAGCPALTLFSMHSDPALSAPRGPKALVLACDDLGLLSVDDVMKHLPERARHASHARA